MCIIPSFILTLATHPILTRMQEGSKAIFHLEAFVAKFMSAYKIWAMSAFG